MKLFFFLFLCDLNYIIPMASFTLHSTQWCRLVVNVELGEVRMLGPMGPCPKHVEGGPDRGFTPGKFRIAVGDFYGSHGH
jgi:hypothetical protein